LITTSPNQKLAPHGLQVPLLLSRKQIMPWLRSRTNMDLIKEFVQPPGESSLKLKITVEPSTSVANRVTPELELA